MTMDDPDSGQGRQPRVGESGAPVGSILSIVLAVVAVIVGFVILKQINDDEDGGGGANAALDPPATNADDNGDNGDNGGTTTNPDGTTTSTRPPGPVNTFKGAKVVVANASGVPGSASEMSTKLSGVGFSPGEPEDAGGDESRLDESKVYYKPASDRARPVAETVARSLRIGTVAEMPAEEPVVEGPIDGAVLVMLGADKATADPRDLRGN